jgi:hypothetical protein
LNHKGTKALTSELKLTLFNTFVSLCLRGFKNMSFIIRVIPACILAFMLSSHAGAEVTAEKSDRGVVVKIDGKLFTEYLTKAGHAPAMWPVMGPTNEPMTRAWPVGPSRDGMKETDDHPHHQSLWFTHDKVNGVDYWKANVNDDMGDGGPHIAHREFKGIESGGATARIVTRNDWMDGKKRICEDERTIVYGTRKNGDRWIDFTITIKATDGDVTFGDTKEGTFAIRVADPMRVEAKFGGRFVNSEGEVDGAAWGVPAKWVDYTGPLVAASLRDAKSRVGDTRLHGILGIAIMSHPKSFRPTPRWHVREYGLFTANPFGQSDFPKPDAAQQGAFTIKEGESITLRYRVLLHRGTTESADIESAFQEFAGG